MVVAYVEVDNDGVKDWKKIGRTECIRDLLNPKFVETFKVSFNFAKPQRVNFLATLQILTPFLACLDEVRGVRCRLF